LISIDERVRLVAGQVLITSKPGQGTVITVRAPAARNADAEGTLAVGTP
jgi:signal transduction histidine kinase